MIPQDKLHQKFLFKFYFQGISHNRQLRVVLHCNPINIILIAGDIRLTIV